MPPIYPSNVAQGVPPGTLLGQSITIDLNSVFHQYMTLDTLTIIGDNSSPDTLFGIKNTPYPSGGIVKSFTWLLSSKGSSASIDISVVVNNSIVDTITYTPGSLQEIVQWIFNVAWLAGQNVHIQFDSHDGVTPISITGWIIPNVVTV